MAMTRSLRRPAYNTLWLMGVAAAFAVTGCTQRDASSKPPPPESSTIAKAQVDNNDPAQFWVKFREAVLNSDTSALLQLTSRPLQTRAALDGAPWISRDSTAIVALLDSLLATDPGLQSTPTTMRELVRRTTSLDAASQAASDEFRIGEFVFMRTGGQWRFAKAYLPD